MTALSSCPDQYLKNRHCTGHFLYHRPLQHVALSLLILTTTQSVAAVVLIIIIINICIQHSHMPSVQFTTPRQQLLCHRQLVVVY